MGGEPTNVSHNYAKEFRVKKSKPYIPSSIWGSLSNLIHWFIQFLFQRISSLLTDCYLPSTKGINKS